MIKKIHNQKYNIVFILKIGFMLFFILFFNIGYANNHNNYKKETSVIDAKQTLNQMLEDKNYIIVKKGKKLEAKSNTSNVDNKSFFWEKLYQFIKEKFLDSNPTKIQKSIFFLLKLVLVLLLIFIFYKVWKYRYRVLEFFDIYIKNNKPVVQSWCQDELLQGWEKLPNHIQIPKTVKLLLDNQKIIEASSLLYRASLRWLVQQKNVAIFPAYTELQCQQQIQQISQSQGLQANQVNFLIQIIKTWLPIAYNNTYHQQDNAKQQLAEFATQWVNMLPIINTQEIKDCLTEGGEL